MKKLARIGLCLFAAFIVGGAAFVAVATFGPLLFPEPLSGSGAGENLVLLALPLASLVFGAGGFVLAWRLTKGLVDKPITLDL